jgi:ribose transport system substrate-binding protein
MKLSRLLLLGLGALALAAIPACSNKGSGKLKIAVVTNNTAEFWTICRSGAEKAAREFDVDLDFRTPEKGEVGEQMQMVKSLAEQGFNGISVSVIDPKEQTPDLKIIAAKTKLVTMDNDAEGSNRICYVGTDNYAAGKEVGRLVKEVLPNGGDVAIFVGQITPINAQLRFQGVVDELAGENKAQGTPEDYEQSGKKRYIKRYGKYRLYKGEAITDDTDREKALQNAKLALEGVGDHPDFCMIGLWAYNPPKILEAISSKEFKSVKVVGFDEDWATLKAIDDGRMHATVVQDPFNFGYKSVEILTAEAKGDQSKRNIKPIPYRIVTKEGGKPKNIDGVEIVNRKATEFRDELRALLDSAAKK